MLEKAPRSRFALGCFFHFTGTVIANTLRHTTKVAGCSYVCVMVEVIDTYKNHRFPIYGLCQSDSEKEPSDNFGYISRNSGGELLLFSSEDADTKFNELKNYFNDISLVHFKSTEKKSLGTAQLVIKTGGTKLSQDILVNAEVDKTKPKVKKIAYNKDNNTFKITFSEKVENADKLSNYKILKDGEKEQNIVSVKYQALSATVYMEKTVYSGSYTFKFSGITDISDNANKLESSSKTVDVEATPIAYKIIIIVCICAVPVLFLAAIYVILIKVKQKKNVSKIKDIFIAQVEEKEYEQVHIEQAKGVPITLYIDAADGKFHTINYNLISSAIFGRSPESEIVVDDMLLSRQHFVLESVENGFAVTDLNSRNGTFVNGVQIRSRTFVSTDSKITAGNTTIRIKYNERELKR